MIVVDDDENILEIVTFALEELPIDIRYCHSGQEAIQEALSFQPDLILLDFMMPNMDGEAVLHAMRLIPTLANIPVIFLTAKIQKEEREQYLKMGAVQVIGKPFDPMTLGETIQKYWNEI